MDVKLREGAVDTFNREWTASFDAGLELEHCFHRLTEQMTRLAEAGLHMHIEFPEPLQAWWVTYRESQGDLIPHSPVEAPLPKVEA
jgi:hypothetical protein